MGQTTSSSATRSAPSVVVKELVLTQRAQQVEQAPAPSGAVKSQRRRAGPPSDDGCWR
jgi:hypothetical protein